MGYRSELRDVTNEVISGIEKDIEKVEAKLLEIPEDMEDAMEIIKEALKLVQDTLYYIR